MDPPSPSNSIKTPDPSHVTIISNACSSQLRPLATYLISPGVLHELPVDYSCSTVLPLVFTDSSSTKSGSTASSSTASSSTANAYCVTASIMMLNFQLLFVIR